MCDASLLRCEISRRPQIVIARCPDQLRETRLQCAKDEIEMRRRFTRIAGDDQPIIRKRLQRLHRTPVLLESDVQIADRPQLHPPSLSELRRDKSTGGTTSRMRTG